MVSDFVTIKKLLDRRMEINSILCDIRKSWCWEDRIPYIHKLNTELKSIDSLLDEKLYKEFLL